jgi:chitinase
LLDASGDQPQFVAAIFPTSISASQIHLTTFLTNSSSVLTETRHPQCQLSNLILTHSPRISGHHAQLYSTHGGGSTQPALDYLYSQSFPSSKILLGIPTYGWSFLNCNNINQTCNSCGGSGGAFDFKDLPRPGTQELVDEAPVAAFCVGGDGGFVTYDNVQTVTVKAGEVRRRELGGIFFWHGLADKTGDGSLVYASYQALHS